MQFTETLDIGQLIPPQNIEAEESILGGIMLDPEAIGRVVDILASEAFYVKTHREIYEAILKLHAQSKPTDLMSVTSWLQDCHLLDRVGGTATLAQLIDRTVSAINIDRYAALVMDKYKRRELIKLARQLEEKARDCTTPWEDLMQQAQRDLFNLNDGIASDSELTHIGDIFLDVAEQLTLVQEGKRQPAIATGIYDLDDLLGGGMSGGELIVVAARPGMGKSAFVTNIAENVARKEMASLIFSMEMDRQQVVQRIAARRCKLPINLLRQNNLSQDDINNFYGAVENASDLPIWVADPANPSFETIASQVRKFKQSNSLSIGCVFIDYLQLMDYNSEFAVKELGKITRNSKKFARELNIPVILLSQLSRGVEQRTDKRPLLSDLRDSGSIEQDADVVIMLYRDNYYNPNTEVGDEAEIIVRKQRNGPTGTVRVDYIGEFLEFRSRFRG